MERGSAAVRLVRRKLTTRRDHAEIPRPPIRSCIGVAGVPSETLALSSFHEPDYADLFTAPVPGATDQSPEGWARAILEEAPASRHSAYDFWRLIGLHLGPRGSHAHVQGWRIADRSADSLRLETRSWYTRAEAVVKVGADHVSVSLFLQYESPVARIIWAAIAGLHARAVPVMLRQAVKAHERSR